MSLEIDAAKVKEVLLADGWHVIEAGSFDLDAYEYVKDGLDILRGGQIALVPSTGATWVEGGRQRFCPLMAILAVSY